MVDPSSFFVKVTFPEILELETELNVYTLTLVVGSVDEGSSLPQLAINAEIEIRNKK